MSETQRDHTSDAGHDEGAARMAPDLARLSERPAAVAAESEPAYTESQQWQTFEEPPLELEHEPATEYPEATTVSREPTVPGVKSITETYWGAPPPEAARPARLRSLDALRGFDMIWITGFHKVVIALVALVAAYAGKMITIKGQTYDYVAFITDQLEHGPWNSADYGRLASGFHFYDMIMPLFLFMAGVSLPFSFEKRMGLGQRKMRIYFHVLVRFALLFVLGMIHQGHLLNFNLSDPKSDTFLHIYSNTLQAIACGYLIASILFLEFRPSTQVWITLGLIGIYWALLQFIPAPGGTHGVLTSESNLAVWLDHKILGNFHDGTKPPHAYSWILTSMVFGATVMIGSFAGQFLHADYRPWRKAFAILFAGAALTAAGVGMSLKYPIVKYIWSSSFVLFSGGICLMLLGLFYLVIDVWGLKFWTLPFVVFGANAIFAYMSGQFLQYDGIVNRIIGGTQKWFTTDTAARWHGKDWYSLVQATLAFGILWLILHWMYKKKTFIRV